MRPVRRIGLLVGAPLLAGLLITAAVAASVIVLPEPAHGEEPWFTVTKLDAADFTGAPTEPFFVAIIGNDAREGLGGARGDALQLAGVNPQTKSATILDIPRDTVLSIPGRGRDKATHAFAYGGLRLTVEMLEQWVGVPIAYAITTDFAGFVTMVDHIGGVDIEIREPMHDRMSGSDFTPGPTRLDGNQSLAFNRDRYSFSSGDVSRTENQGYFLISTLATLREQNPGAAGLMRILVSVVHNTEYEGMGLTEMFRLASLALSVNPGDIRNVVVPGDPSALFADFADGAMLTRH